MLAGRDVADPRPDRPGAEGRRGRLRHQDRRDRRQPERTRHRPGSAISTSAATCWWRPTRATSASPTPDRTVAVVSTSKVPTGAMVTDTGDHVPRRRTRSPNGSSEATAGGGFGLSRCALPVPDPARRATSSPTSCSPGPRTRTARCRCPAKAIEQAIELNGVQVRQQPAGIPVGPAVCGQPGCVRIGGRRADAGRRAARPDERRARSYGRSRGRAAGRSLRGCSPSASPIWSRTRDCGYARRLRRFVARVRDAERAVARRGGAGRGGGQVPLQAHGLQGRVRGGAARARPDGPRGGARRVRPGCEGVPPAPPADPARARHEA